MLSAFSRARARRPVIRWRRGSWPGAGAATGMLLIDSAIARTGVFRVPHTLCVFSCTREAAVIRGGGVVAGRRRSYGDAADRQRDRANGGLPRSPCSLRFLCAREESVIRWRRGSWPGAGAATGTLLIDSAIARTGVLPRSACSPRFLVRARGARHQVAAGVVAGRRCSYGDAADRQRDRANGGLAAFRHPLRVFSCAREAAVIRWRRGRGRAPVQLRGCC